MSLKQKKIIVKDHNGREQQVFTVTEVDWKFQPAWNKAWDEAVRLYPPNRFYHFCDVSEGVLLPDPK